jgi:cytochrome c-type biogenesis protein CcmH
VSGTRRLARAAARLVALVAFAFAFAARSADAQPQRATMPDSVLDARTRAVASELRCPVCQGESIEESPSDLAQELKRVVREQLAAGRTPAQVKEYFVGRYGEWILLRPTARGFNYAVYLGPPLLLLAGGAFLFVLLRRWTRPAPPDAPVEPELDDPLGRPS